MLIDTIVETRPDAIVISDYAKGAVPDMVIEAAVRRADDLDVPVVVDPARRASASSER